MSILSIVYVDCDNDPDEIEGEWEIKENCFIYYTDKGMQRIIPLHNIFMISEYMEQGD